MKNSTISYCKPCKYIEKINKKIESFGGGKIVSPLVDIIGRKSTFIIEYNDGKRWRGNFRCLSEHKNRVAH